MGSVIQFAACLYICCLIRVVLTHSDKDTELKNNLANLNNPSDKDFYFEDQTANDGNPNTGRPISQSAWSKEDKETQPAEDKTGTQLNDELSLKNVVSYLLKAIDELKKDIFGIKETASQKQSTNSQGDIKDTDKQNKKEGNDNESNSDDSSKNAELKKDNHQPNSNYLTDHYQKNGIKFVDDDLENSSDMSDDSSHKPNEELNKPGVNKNDENIRKFRCMKIERGPGKYPFEAEITTANPPSQTEMPTYGVKESHESRENGKDYYIKKSTTMPEKIEQLTTPKSNKGKGKKKNDENSPNKNEPIKSAEYEPTKSPQNENSDTEKSNKDKIDHNSPDEDLKNKGSSDFNKPGIIEFLTTLSSQTENEPNSSGMFTEQLIQKKHQEQITSPEPEYFKTTDEANENTTFSSQSVSVFSDYIVNTESYASETEIKDSSKESKNRRNKPYSERDKHQTSNTINAGNTAPTASANTMNVDNLDKDLLDSTSDKQETNKNDDSEESKSKKNINDSKNRGDNKNKQPKAQQLNDAPKSESSLKNKKFNNSNLEKYGKEEEDNLDSTAKSDFPSQNPNPETQNHKTKESDKSQKTPKINENVNKKAEMHEISPDEEYDYEGDSEDFDISDELNDMQDYQYQEYELNIYDENSEESDEINTEITETFVTSESQRSQNVGYFTEKKSQEQYDTFLEYFYKHSNSPFFQVLKNQSNKFSQEHINQA